MKPAPTFLSFTSNREYTMPRWMAANALRSWRNHYRERMTRAPGIAIVRYSLPGFGQIRTVRA